LLFAAEALAVPVIYINKGTTSEYKPTFEHYSGGEFFSKDNFGQTVGFNFAQSLAGIADIRSGALFELSGVYDNNKTYLTAGDMLNQNTTGGIFSLWSDEQKTELLLSGTIGDGILSGQNNAAGYESRQPASTLDDFITYESWDLSITSGILKSYFPTNKADITLNLGHLSHCMVFSKRCFLASSDHSGFTAYSDGALSTFRVSLNWGKITGKPAAPTCIPEPATVCLLLGGLFGAGIKKKKFNKA
jgi:hypothetical protein